VDTHEVLLRSPSPPRPAGPVQIYLAGQPQPDRPYYDVALLQAVGYGEDGNFEAVVRALADRGAEIGCEALVRVRVVQGWSRSHGYGACVRWSPVAAPRRAAPPASPPPGPLPPAEDDLGSPPDEP
jgi:hypothetical protein